METEYHNMEESSLANESLLEAALHYANGGFRVFPCVPGTKKPLTERGFKDATTHYGTVREWWQKWPDANIGYAIPAGEVVLDVDRRHGGWESLEALEAEHGRLPVTRLVSTPDNGAHLNLRLPDGVQIKSSSGKLGAGLDVLTEGKYVLLPPSRIAGFQRIYDPLPEPRVADCPPWLLELLAQRERASTEDSGTSSTAQRRVNVSLAGESILAGERNDTLTAIMGKLHDGTRSESELVEDTQAVNLARCEPPLELGEIEAMARHRITTPLCSPSGISATPEVLEALDGIEVNVWQRQDWWKGKAGDSRWNIAHALIRLARSHGELIPAGVRVSIGHRDLAEEAGLGKSTIDNNIPDMSQDRILRPDNAGRKSNEAGAFVLLSPESGDDSNSGHTTIPRGAIEPRVACGPDLSHALYALYRLRHAAPGYQRLGPRAGRVMLALLGADGEAAAGEIAAALGMRTSNLTRSDGILDRLQQKEMVEWTVDAVRLPENWQQHLHEAIESGAEDAADKRDAAKHRYERAHRAHDRYATEETKRQLTEAHEAYLKARTVYRARSSANNLVVTIKEVQPDHMEVRMQPEEKDGGVVVEAAERFRRRGEIYKHHQPRFSHEQSAFDPEEYIPELEEPEVEPVVEPEDPMDIPTLEELKA